MRILCCLDGTNVRQMSHAVETLLGGQTKTIAVLYVTDSGPEIRMEQQRELYFRPAHTPSPRQEQMRRAENMAAQDILEEGSRALSEAQRLWRTGRPEREIVQVAQEWQADMVVVGARSTLVGEAPSGPKSVGHVARFILDHAPCPVLLIRPVRSDSPPSSR